jgi:pimeloyl-ACP methyl ester carboxylesterase
LNITNQFIDINNSKQNILTLTTSTTNPVLLIVHGGPGSPDRPLVYKYNSDLANYFTVICWDQRCAGLSYSKENKKLKLCVDTMIADLYELVLYLTKKYNQEKIYIAGHSWGAYLGVRFVEKHPQFVKYYIGTGQGISSLVDEIDKYNFIKDKAIEHNDKHILDKINYYGTPNGYNYPNDSEKARKYIGKLVNKYGGYIHQSSDLSMKSYFSTYLKFYKANIFKVIAGINYSVKCLNPEINSEDTISKIEKLDVPILLISGEQDYICPVQTTEKWFNKLSAPNKKFVIIKNASHMVNFEKPDEWNSEIIKLLRYSKRKDSILDRGVKHGYS